MIKVGIIVEVGETTHAVVFLVRQHSGAFADVPFAVIAVHLDIGME